jgi:hypothetical protein
LLALAGGPPVAALAPEVAIFGLAPNGVGAGGGG